MADAYYELGAASRLQGSFALALDFARRIIKIDSELSALDPVNTDLKGQLGQAYCLLGDIYLGRSSKAPGRSSRYADLKEALSSYGKALDIYKNLRQAGALPHSQIPELERISREILHCNALLGKPNGDAATRMVN
jgi:tetratricopeptide (TPR) repeat protein